MENNKYPRLGSSTAINGGICVICGKEKANVQFNVETNVMRGDDDSYNIHFDCSKPYDFYQLLPLLKNNIKIIGNEWLNCYLHDDNCIDRKTQVINDLKERIKKGDFKQWDTLSIDCKDHSSAFEMFEVVKIISWCNVVLTYSGGGS